LQNLHAATRYVSSNFFSAEDARRRHAEQEGVLIHGRSIFMAIDEPDVTVHLQIPIPKAALSVENRTAVCIGATLRCIIFSAAINGPSFRK